MIVERNFAPISADTKALRIHHHRRRLWYPSPRSTGGRIGSASKLRKKVASTPTGRIVGSGNAGRFAPILLALPPRPTAWPRRTMPSTGSASFGENTVTFAPRRSDSSLTPSKLKVGEQRALILDRTGHHTSLNSKKTNHAGDTLICAELRRVLDDPSLMPATPVAEDSGGSEVPEPADEGSRTCGATTMSGAACCHSYVRGHS